VLLLDKQKFEEFEMYPPVSIGFVRSEFIFAVGGRDKDNIA